MKTTLAFVLLLVSASAWAQEPASDTTVSRLRMWHRDPSGVQVAGTKRPRSRMQPNEKFYLRKNGLLNVVVLDTNPLLFTYAASKGSSTPSANQQALDAFIKAFGTFGGLLPQPPANKAAAGITSIDGLDVTAIRDVIRRVDTAVNGLSGTLDQSLKVTGDSEESFARALADFQSLFSDWPALTQKGRQQLQGLSALLSKCAQDANSTVSTVPAAEGGALLTCSSISIRSVIDPLADYRSTLTDRIAVMETLYSDVQQFRAFTTDPVPFERTDASIIIEVKPNPKYSAFLSDSAKRIQASASTKIVVPLTAYSNWTISPGPAFVVSWVRNPTFSTVPEGTKFRVVKKDDGEPNSYSAGAMLNFQPRKLYDPAVSLLFQVGVTPTKDQLGILAGPAIAFDEKLVVGIGYMRRQLRALDGPELLDSPDQLKTKSVWRGGGGAYLVVTYKP